MHCHLLLCTQYEHVITPIAHRVPPPLGCHTLGLAIALFERDEPLYAIRSYLCLDRRCDKRFVTTSDHVHRAEQHFANSDHYL